MISNASQHYPSALPIRPNPAFSGASTKAKPVRFGFDVNQAAPAREEAPSAEASPLPFKNLKELQQRIFQFVEDLVNKFKAWLDSVFKHADQATQAAKEAQVARAATQTQVESLLNPEAPRPHAVKMAARTQSGAAEV